MRPLDLFRDAGNMAQYARGFFPPDFTEWRSYLSELVVTLQIALWGTALAIVCSVPLALLAASNIAPWWVYQPVRRVLDACRSDPQPVEGIRATGAHPLHEIAFGVIPQVMPLWVSYALYRFESNVRSASVVGMVGAGGIGMVLWEVIRGFQYAQTAAVMLMLVVSVSCIDLVSAQLRKRMI